MIVLKLQKRSMCYELYSDDLAGKKSFTKREMGMLEHERSTWSEWIARETLD